MVLHFNVSLLLRVAKLGIALDVRSRILKIIPKFLSSLLPELNQRLGLRGNAIPFLDVALVTERLQVENSILPIERTGNDVIDVTDQLLSVDFTTA